MLLTRTHKANKNQWVSRHIGQQQRHWRYQMFSNTRSRFPLFYPCANIKIYHECEGGIEKIVPWIHSLSSPDGSQLITNVKSEGPIFSWMMTNCESEGRIFSRVITNGESEGRFFFYPILTKIMGSFSQHSTLHTSFSLEKHENEFQKIMNTLRCDMVT